MKETLILSSLIVFLFIIFPFIMHKNWRCPDRWCYVNSIVWHATFFLQSKLQYCNESGSNDAGQGCRERNRRLRRIRKRKVKRRPTLAPTFRFRDSPPEHFPRLCVQRTPHAVGYWESCLEDARAKVSNSIFSLYPIHVQPRAHPPNDLLPSFETANADVIKSDVPCERTTRHGPAPAARPSSRPHRYRSRRGRRDALLRTHGGLSARTTAADEPQ